MCWGKLLQKHDRSRESFQNVTIQVAVAAPVLIVRSYGTIGVKLRKYTNFGGGLPLKEFFNGTSYISYVCWWNFCKSQNGLLDIGVKLLGC